MGRPKPRPRSRNHAYRSKRIEHLTEVPPDGNRISARNVSSNYLDTNKTQVTSDESSIIAISHYAGRLSRTDLSVSCEYSFDSTMIEEDISSKIDKNNIKKIAASSHITSNSTESLPNTEERFTSDCSERLPGTDLLTPWDYSFDSSVVEQNVDRSTFTNESSKMTASSSKITSGCPERLLERGKYFTSDSSERLPRRENKDTSDCVQRLPSGETLNSPGILKILPGTSSSVSSEKDQHKSQIDGALPRQEEIDDTIIIDDGPLDRGRIKEIQVEGRRIVDINYFLQSLHKKFDKHNVALQCPFSDLKLIGSFDRGLRTQLQFKCQLCNYRFYIWTDPDEKNILGINESAVCGTITSGTGHSTLQEQLSAMSIPPMAANTYIKYRNRLFHNFHEAAEDERKRAASIEREMAIKKGHVIDGIPYINVIADGCWAKRSYAGGKHDALSGAAMIFGSVSKLVLFVGVRNKYCATHERARQLNKEPPEHKCYKNWNRNQSSTSMETDIILEGFKTSVACNGLIYKNLIADGDSSVFQAIRDANPYAKHRIIVQKIECNNHLFRNLCRKMSTASAFKFTSCPAKGTFTVTEFRQLISSSGLKIRKCVESARDFRKAEETSDDEKAAQLCKDIFIILNHVFGEHSNCSSLPFTCEPKKNEKNAIEQLRVTGVWPSVYEAVRFLSSHAKSLLKSVTNNIAEACNSIVNKLNSGKRINHCSANSYEMRCLGAVVQYNTKSALSKVHLQKANSVPNAIKKMERSRQLKNEYNRVFRRNGLRRRRRQFVTTDKDYGPSARKPDLDEDVFDVLAQEHFKRLQTYQSNWEQIERETTSQNSSEVWHQLRTEILTASRFGAICRMLPKTSCQNMVKAIRYPKVTDSAAMKFGRENEETARQQLASQLGREVIPCGLFIDQEIAYLGASPDGLIDDDGIVEIKCPFSARNSNWDDALQENSNLRRIFDKNDSNVLNRNHIYYYQVQGQLHVTKRKYCVFVLWTSVDMKIVTVLKDDQFWETKMEPFLRRFYMDCLLPEIIDSRHNRNMPIRNPRYMLKARDEARKKRMSRSTCEGKLFEPSEKIKKSCRDGCDSTQIIKEAVISSLKIEKMTNSHDWVTIDSDEETDSPGEKARLLEIVRKNISADEVITQVLSPTNLLNDSSIDLFQNILQENSSFRCNPASYTAFYTCIEPCPPGQRDLQIIGGNRSRHWICVYYDTSSILVYDSLNPLEYEFLSEEVKRYLAKRYPHCGTEDVILPLLTKQPDSFSCGVYAAAFATTIALGSDPVKRTYSRQAVKMRSHLAAILKDRKLSEFPSDTL